MIGVANDDDLDRMGDLYLVAEKATPLLPVADRDRATGQKRSCLLENKVKIAHTVKIVVIGHADRMQLQKPSLAGREPNLRPQ